MIFHGDHFQAKRDSAVALGFFDGVHLGHRRVIHAAADYAREKGLLSGVFTFTLDGVKPMGKMSKFIDSSSMKQRQLQEMGLDYIYSPSFSLIREMSPEQFLDEILVRRCLAKVVSCGVDFRFGAGAVGDVETLKRLCAQKGIEVLVQKSVKDRLERVSSSRIREFLESGEMEKAAEMLGRPYAFDFEVQAGKQLGRTIGLPTINQFFPPENVVPKSGVYISKTIVDGRAYPSVTNLGSNPTFEESFRAETHIIRYEGNLYGKQVEVRLFHYLRPERKFDSIELLRGQIREDIEEVINYRFA